MASLKDYEQGPCVLEASTLNWMKQKRRAFQAGPWFWRPGFGLSRGQKQRWGGGAQLRVIEKVLFQALCRAPRGQPDMRV